MIRFCCGLLVLLLTAAPSGCVDGPDGVRASVHANTRRDNLVEKGLRFPISSRESVIVELGLPDSISSRPTPNRHRPALTDSIVDHFRPGLTLRYYVVGEDDRDILQIADVRENRYLAYPRLGIGARAATVVAALGEPVNRTDNTYSYRCGRCAAGNTPVIFHFAGDRVSRLEFVFYVD